MALEDKRGTKSKLDPDKMERDELLDYVKIMEETKNCMMTFSKRKWEADFYITLSNYEWKI